MISYYDDINNLHFNTTKKQIQFTMPFNWNITRLEEQKQVMVHEEDAVPWRIAALALYFHLFHFRDVYDVI